MSNISLVEIAVRQTIIDQYSSNLVSKKLSLSEQYDLESILQEDLTRIARKKNVVYEIVSGNLMYFEPNSSLGDRLGYFPLHSGAGPNWGLSIPILNSGSIELSYFTGNYTTTLVATEKSTYYVPNWVGNPELVESELISSTILMNLETPFSYQNQSSNPSMILNLRFTPSLLAL